MDNWQRFFVAIMKSLKETEYEGGKRPEDVVTYFEEASGFYWALGEIEAAKWHQNLYNAAYAALVEVNSEVS